jgi:hypothetical protein
MARSRRARWLFLLPFFAIVGTALLPQPDAFAFMKEGKAVSPDALAGIRNEWNRHFPLRTPRDRAWDFSGRADDVLTTIRRRLTRPRGWCDVAQSTDTIEDRKGRRRVVQAVYLFQNEDTGALAIFVDHKGTRNPVACSVLVREPRNPWGKVKSLVRNLIPR